MLEGAPSLWQAELNRPRRTAALPARVEVLVVGGGISGVALLSQLATRGIGAALVERDRLGAGASGRNAGFLLTGVAANYARAVATYGRETAAEIWRFTAANHRLLRGSVEPAAMGYRCRGAWTVAESAVEAAALEESAQLLAEDGLPGRWAPAGRAPRWAPLGALEVDGDGEVNPLRAVEAIAPPGSAVHEGVAVVGLHHGPQGVRVDLGERGEMVAEQVILATNAWTAQLVPEVPIRPVRAQMLCTAAAATITDRPVYAGWGYRYFRQLGDGRLLMGGCRDLAVADEVGYGLAPTAPVQAGLDLACTGLGVTAPVLHRWAGTMGFTADELPLVGPLSGRPGVWVMGGYTGHGMGFALQCAWALVERVADGRPLPGWCDTARLAAVATPDAASG
ncbi:MAG: NAD(P)/FAD-dependent oxidoreductase [Candidatus Dormibacteria bacterium]